MAVREARDCPSIAGGVSPAPAADGAAPLSAAGADGRDSSAGRGSGSRGADPLRRRAGLEHPGQLTLDPAHAQLDAAQRLAQVGHSTLEQVDTPGLGVQHLHLALEVVPGRRLHRLSDGVEFGARVLGRLVRMLRPRPLSGLQSGAELGDVSPEAIDLLAKSRRRVGWWRRLRLAVGLRAAPAHSAAAHHARDQHRRERQSRGPSPPHTAVEPRPAPA